MHGHAPRSIRTAICSAVASQFTARGLAHTGPKLFSPLPFLSDLCSDSFSLGKSSPTVFSVFSLVIVKIYARARARDPSILATRRELLISRLLRAVAMRYGRGARSHLLAATRQKSVCVSRPVAPALLPVAASLKERERGKAEGFFVGAPIERSIG